MLNVRPRLAALPSYPITAEARAAVLAEAASIEQELAGASRPGVEDDGRAAARLVERLEAMRATLERAEVVEDPGVAAIGRRVTLACDGGQPEAYALVLPGDGDPDRGWISIDSPLGTALAGRRAGEQIVIEAPAGAWTATVAGVA